MLKYENEYLLEIGCIPSRRIIHLDQELDADIYRNVVTSLLFLDQKPDPITLLINCPGGQDELCYGIYDAIMACSSHITGIVLGQGYSAASIILQACDLRVMSRNSLLLLHDGDLTIPSHNSDHLHSNMKVLELLLNKMYKAYARQSTLTVEEIKQLCKKETYLNPEEAMKYKLIDQIMEGWSEIL